MLKVKIKGYQDVIYGYEAEACGFGDAWAVTNYLLRASEYLGKPVRFYCSNHDLKSRVMLISTFLETRGKIIFAWKGIEKLLGYCDPYVVKFVKTKRKWIYNPFSKIVAYQFDGRHLAHQKNMPDDKVRFLVKHLTMMGYHAVDVGHMKPLSFVIDTLAKCRFFVGCPSGIAHVSQSVGNPIYVITRHMHSSYLRFMRLCQYRTAEVKMSQSVFEFLRLIREEQPCLCLS